VVYQTIVLLLFTLKVILQAVIFLLLLKYSCTVLRTALSASRYTCKSTSVLGHFGMRFFNRKDKGFSDLLHQRMLAIIGILVHCDMIRYDTIRWKSVLLPAGLEVTSISVTHFGSELITEIGHDEAGNNWLTDTTKASVTTPNIVIRCFM